MLKRSAARVVRLRALALLGLTLALAAGATRAAEQTDDEPLQETRCWGWGPPMYPIYPAPYWGGVAAGMSYNSRTGTLAAGQRGAARNTGEAVRTGHIRGEQGTVARVGDDIYAGHDGNVYQRSDNGWEQLERGGASTQAAEQTRQQLDRDMSAQSHGAEQYAGDKPRRARCRAAAVGGADLETV